MFRFKISIVVTAFVFASAACIEVNASVENKIDSIDDSFVDQLELNLHMLKGAVRPLNPSVFKRKEYRHNAWAWSYRARTAIQAYRLTGDKRYILEVIAGIEYFVKLKQWKTWNKSRDLWFYEVTTVGLIAIPVLDLLLLSSDDEYVHSLVKGYKDDWLAVVVDNIDSLEVGYRRRGPKGYYLTPLDHSKVEALNHMAVFATANARLFEFTREEKYRQKVDQIHNFWIASSWKPSQSTLAWPYTADLDESQNSKPAEPYWKASITIELAVAAHRIGLLENTKELHRIRSILTDNLLAYNSNNKLVWNKLVRRIDGDVKFKLLLQVEFAKWYTPYNEKITRLDALKEKKRPAIAMWHLLDCAGQRPIKGLSHRINDDIKTNSSSMSRSIYGLVVGKVAENGLCDTVISNDLANKSSKSPI